jgi:predicted alpha-1,2-mannosidase
MVMKKFDVTPETRCSRGHAAAKAGLYGCVAALMFLGENLRAGGIGYPIDPFMGVAGRGNVAIGPQLPWGAIQPGPDTEDGASDGYHPRRKIRGFSQLHVTGTGSYGKYGQFLISPQIGLVTGETGHDSEKADETAEITEYKVRLKDYDIFCELAPAAHSAIYRFTYPASDRAHLLLDLGYSIPEALCRAGYVDGGEVVVDAEKQMITGWGSYWGGWSAEAVRVYFAARVDTRVASFGVWKDNVPAENVARIKVAHPKEHIGAYLGFKTASNQPVMLKIGVSFSSVENALDFVDKEIPAWDYAAVKEGAVSAWNNRLGRVQVEGASDEQKTLFYSTLYNTMRMPRDRSGDNPSWRSSEPYWDDYYCVWDTWRTLFPLHILLHEGVVRDNVRALVDRFKHNGQVLDGFVGGNDRYYKWIGEGIPEWLQNQGGDDVDNLIADAYVKGVSGVDWQAAFALVKAHAEQERAPSYRAMDRGWIPFRKYGFGLYCSRTLEFAYNDFCAAEMAQGLGYTNEALAWRQRSLRWENLWNPEAHSDGYKGFIAPRWSDGAWLDYDPRSEHAVMSAGGVDRAFYQGSSWVYSYFAPHDFARLIELSGGSAAYCERLQYALSHNLIDFSNEPSFLTPFSLIYGGRPDLCAFWVRRNAQSYTLTRGFPGDEDSGAMSAWYVFAALGLMPNAGQDFYLLHGPMYPRAVLTMENGKQIVIEGVNASPENLYVQSLTLNGAPCDRAWVRHSELKDGATLRFVMGSEPSSWGRATPPPSAR